MLPSTTGWDEEASVFQYPKQNAEIYKIVSVQVTHSWMDIRSETSKILLGYQGLLQPPVLGSEVFPTRPHKSLHRAAVLSLEFSYQEGYIPKTLTEFNIFRKHENNFLEANQITLLVNSDLAKLLEILFDYPKELITVS